MSRENTSYFVPGINTSSPHNDIWQTDNNPRLDDHHTFLSLRNAEEVRGRIISQWRNLVSCVLFHHLPSGHRRGVKGPSLAWLLIEGSGSELNDIAVKRNLFYQSTGDTWMILINFFVLIAVAFRYWTLIIIDTILQCDVGVIINIILCHCYFSRLVQVYLHLLHSRTPLIYHGLISTGTWDLIKV